MANEQCDPTLVAKKPLPQPTVTALAAPTAAVRAAEPPSVATKPLTAPTTAARTTDQAPVVVRPLSPPAAKQERALEPERSNAIPAPVAAATRSAALPPAKAQPLERMTLSGDALFPLDSFHLKASAKERLDALLAKVQNMKYESIKVIGNSDPTGSEALNKRLSWQRAEVVKGYLVARGLDASKIETEGVGSADPAVLEKDCAALPRAQKIACYQPDRRVQIDVQGLSSKAAGAVTANQRK
jgi:OOP family OmpA-OmpF porin